MRIKGFTTKRILSAEDVRNVCIKHNYYTRGDVKAYEKMLDRFIGHDKIVSDALLITTAEDIYQHTDIPRMCKEYGCDEEECLREILFELMYASSELIDQFEVEE